MLSPEDQQNLIQLVEECKQAGFPEDRLLDSLLSRDASFFSMVHMICMRDDWEIDQQEQKLLIWARDLTCRLSRSDMKDIHELTGMLGERGDMLSPEDQQNLRQLGEECRQAGFPEDMLLDSLLSSSRSPDTLFFSMVHMICLDDDGEIDPQEQKLLTWARNFTFRLNTVDIREVMDILKGREDN